MGDLGMMLAALLGVGVVAGFIGGLFGIGGGIIIVPALYAVFGILDVPDAARMKLAVGTSLATIIVTAARSVYAHHRRGAVDLDLLRAWAPWIALGALLGAALARVSDPVFLTLFFAGGLFCLAIQKLCFPPRDVVDEGARLSVVPGGLIRAALATGTGTISSLMGIGGGVIGVVLLTAFGRSIHRAIATAAGFGLAIAVPGAVGFAIAGVGEPGLPVGSAGFVNFPAFGAIAAMTFLTAPWGAALAHRLPGRLLNRIFAGYMLVTSVLLIWDVAR